MPTYQHSMLTDEQAEHFRTFGFVALPRYLGADLTAALESEVDAAIRDAYADTYDERVTDGISGHYLPMASRLTPVSAALVCDDSRFIDAAEALLGGPVIPECPEGVLYFAEAGWHDDDGIGVAGVKFATYFSRLVANTGALRFIPGSHHRDFNQRLTAYRNRRRLIATDTESAAFAAGFPGFPGSPGAPGFPGFPGFVVASSPGDVIAFDVHTWHASFGGKDRLAWTAVYHRCPVSAEELERTHRSVVDGFEQEFRGFDRERYPIWRDWLADADAPPRRRQVVERFRAAGILDLPGAEVGW